MNAPIIYLIGYRGTGKSTIGKILAEQMKWDFADADEVLETRFQKSIRNVFAEEGETGFRDKETAVLSELSQRESLVVATGGGVVLRPENRECLQETGYVIWLIASPKTIWKRMQSDDTTAQRRPDLAQGGLAEIEELLHQRESLYQKCSHWSLDTNDKSQQEASEQIIRHLGQD